MGDGFVIFLVLMGLFVFKVLPQMKAMQKEQADQTGEEEGSLEFPFPPTGTEMTSEEPVKKPKYQTKRTTIKRPPAEVGIRTPSIDQEMKTTEALPEETEYALQSPDDVRKAFVWSEILKRKY